METKDDDNLSGFKGIGFAAVLGLVLIAIGYALVSYEFLWSAWFMLGCGVLVILIIGERRKTYGSETAPKKRRPGEG